MYTALYIVELKKTFPLHTIIDMVFSSHSSRVKLHSHKLQFMNASSTVYARRGTPSIGLKGCTLATMQ